MVWPGPGHGPRQHAGGGGGTRPWPSGAGGEASGAGPGNLGTPGPCGQGTLGCGGDKCMSKKLKITKDRFFSFFLAWTFQ